MPVDYVVQVVVGPVVGPVDGHCPIPVDSLVHFVFDPIVGPVDGHVGHIGSLGNAFQSIIWGYIHCCKHSWIRCLI